MTQKQCQNKLAATHIRSQNAKILEVRGIDPRTSRMLSERSTI
jgi:hypothetical protein